MLAISVAILPLPSAAEQAAELLAPPRSVEELTERLAHGPVQLVDDGGRVLGGAHSGEWSAQLREHDVVDVLTRAHLAPAEAAALWEFFADGEHIGLATPAVLKALVRATDTAKSRQAMWGELAAIARSGKRKEGARTLLGVFEDNRAALLAQLTEVRETQSSTDDMIELMLSSRLFGPTFLDGVAYVSERIPAAVARHIERRRGLGKTASWEYTAFEGMARWKNARLTAAGQKTARPVADLDAAGEDFIVIFNCLHGLDEGFREVILRGLGPTELFNAVVAGEKELYRLGTSGYRKYLHGAILGGIKASGSFEAFLARAVPRVGSEPAPHEAARRGMIFLRVASAYGLVEPVIEAVRNRERFITDVIDAVSDGPAFESNGAVVVSVLTGTGRASSVTAFRNSLLDGLYARYRTERDGERRNLYGSLIAVYQTVAGDPRDKSIADAFPVPVEPDLVPYDKLFSAGPDGRPIHRMFMRMDETDDAQETLTVFRQSIASLNPVAEEFAHHSVFRIDLLGRRFEIFVNAPNAQGIKQGVEDIADTLGKARVETIVGRGHTSIIPPLQKDAQRLLGERLGDVSVVIVGACGGDASLRELIDTFGYKPIIATKATGRQVINNAILKTYIASLAELQPGERLWLTGMLRQATARFRQSWEEDLRNDANLYQVAEIAVLMALMSDSHVRPKSTPPAHMASDEN